MPLPVLLVHGIWANASCFDPLRRALEHAGFTPVEAIDLAPNDGSVPIEELAAQIERRAEAILLTTGAPKLDLVGFSMGALASRYWLQKLGGKDVVRTFVSISGPHRGTLTAFAARHAGVRQMRPSSPLLRDLDSDLDPWGGVSVHTLWTPYDLMIVPARSSRLASATDHRLKVALHRWMISDPRAVERVVTILRASADSAR